MSFGLWGKITGENPKISNKLYIKRQKIHDGPSDPNDDVEHHQKLLMQLKKLQTIDNRSAPGLSMSERSDRDTCFSIRLIHTHPRGVSQVSYLPTVLDQHGKRAEVEHPQSSE